MLVSFQNQNNYILQKQNEIFHAYETRTHTYTTWPCQRSHLTVAPCWVTGLFAPHRLKQHTLPHTYTHSHSHVCVVLVAVGVHPRSAIIFWFAILFLNAPENCSQTQKRGKWWCLKTTPKSNNEPLCGSISNNTIISSLTPF